jgi:cytoskeletal protein RodZ
MMYLLLRDNKQTGPYSLDEIKVKGLKAYDLVWVEGRSAAWRYPSEVEELSAFAPAVEEQPFDRFYKKPTTQGVGGQATQGVGGQATQSVGGQATQGVGVQAGQPNSPALAVMSEANPKRSIYVTMPGGISSREVRRESAPMRDAVPMRETQPVYRNTRTEYIEPVAEILPSLPKRKPMRVWQPVAIGLGVLVLLGVGVGIGLSINKDHGSFKLVSRTSGDNEQPIVRQTAQQLPVKPVSNPAVGNSVTNKDSAISKSTAPTMTTTAVPVVPTPNVTDKAANTGKSSRAAQKQKNLPVKIQVSGVAMPDSMKGAAAGMTAGVSASSKTTVREAVHRTDMAASQPADDKESVKATLANQVAVGTNKYGVGTFGGISNLQVTVTNRSAYSLDLVVVAVSYIQANKKTYKTENLYFRGIGPGSALMLEAPKSSRGITIQYKVTSINSKELGLSEPGI